MVKNNRRTNAPQVPGSLGQIPGMYYDPEKRRYFKLDATKKTADGGAGVNRVDTEPGPTLEDGEATLHTLLSAKLTLNSAARPGVAEEEILPLAPLWQKVYWRNTGCGNAGATLLSREIGDIKRDWTLYGGAHSVHDTASEQYARCLVDHGRLDYLQTHNDPNYNTLSNMEIIPARDGSRDPYICATVDQVPGLLIKKAVTDRVSGRIRPDTHPPIVDGIPNIPVNVTSMKYHESRNWIVLSGYHMTSQRPMVATLDMGPMFAEELTLANPAGRAVKWREWELPKHPYVHKWGSDVRVVAAGRNSSPALFAVGTTHGICVGDAHINQTYWLSPRLPTTYNPAMREFLDIKWHPTNEFILYGGTRDGALWTVDLRTPNRDWSWIQHETTVSRLCPAEYGAMSDVIVTGPKSAMAVYDVRFSKRVGDMAPVIPRKRSRYSKYRHSHYHSRNDYFKDRFTWGQGYPGSIDNDDDEHADNEDGAAAAAPSANRSRPVLRFPEYLNEDTIDLALAVNHEQRIACVGHTNGSLGLFSLRSGRKLRSGDIEEHCYSNNRIRAVQWYTIPGDTTPSLYVGNPLAAHKFGLFQHGD